MESNILTLNPPISIRRHLALRWKFSLKIIRVFSSIFILILLTFYLFQINAVTKASFLASNYEKKIAVFSQENKNLEINFFQTNSLSNIENLLANLNQQYEKTDKIHYIRVLESTAMTK